ncbi:HNH endonuclease [Paludibaculum fermentans]|uniref:HNH endonuclease n=1 Tax=Paludibaculum fermentans TaxID=1473598 RepID=UPI003EBB5074
MTNNKTTHHNGFRVRTIPELTKPQIRRFWNKVEIGKHNDCWNWTASTSFGGYGQFSIQHDNWKASRVAYFLYYGIDPAENMILHSCDNRLCCNPHHLRTGTSKDNTQDAISRGRHVATRTGTVLDQEGREMVKLLYCYDVPKNQIAVIMGISYSTVRNICLHG